MGARQLLGSTAVRAVLDSPARHIAQNLVLSSATARRLAQRGHVTGRAGAPDGAAEILVHLLRVATAAGHAWPADAVVAELGPGQSANVLLGALALGAREVVALDVVPEPAGVWDIACFRAVAAALHARRDELPGIRAVAVDRFDGHDEVPAEARRWTEYDGSRIPIADESLDVVLSYSVLEHVRTPGHVLAEVRRTLRSTGSTWHAIDLRDHYRLGDGEDWLRMLRYTDRAWDRMTSHRSNWVNRLRAQEWRDAFAAAGFDAHDVLVEQPFGEGFDVERLAPPFRQLPREALRASWFEVAATRRG